MQERFDRTCNWCDVDRFDWKMCCNCDGESLDKNSSDNFTQYVRIFYCIDFNPE